MGIPFRHLGKEEKGDPFTEGIRREGLSRKSRGEAAREEKYPAPWNLLPDSVGKQAKAQLVRQEWEWVKWESGLEKGTSVYLSLNLPAQGRACQRLSGKDSAVGVAESEPVLHININD